MPFSCQLADEVVCPRDYSNDLNVYNETFFDIYCHCKLTSTEYIEKTKYSYMIQCVMCEDWFHNTHLLPPLLTKNLETDYVLLCRRCAANINMMPYNELMHPTTKEFVHKYQLDDSAEGSSKRLKTGDSTDLTYKCHQLKRKGDAALDIVVNRGFID